MRRPSPSLHLVGTSVAHANASAAQRSGLPTCEAAGSVTPAPAQSRRGVSHGPWPPQHRDDDAVRPRPPGGQSPTHGVSAAKMEASACLSAVSYRTVPAQVRRCHAQAPGAFLRPPSTRGSSRQCAAHQLRGQSDCEGWGYAVGRGVLSGGSEAALPPSGMTNLFIMAILSGLLHNHIALIA